ncbi:MAG TPA: hypothetical protein VK916_06275 [Gillisia sp.]|nr:hypothetical protein [Gillisia sp.]
MQKPYLLLALLLCLNSCSKEEYSSNNDELLKDTTSPPILNDFSLENFGDPFIKNNLIVNWGQKSTINEENEEYSTNINSKLHNAKDFIFHKYILNVKPAEKGNNRFEIVRLISSQDVENVSLVNLQARKFTGTIISYDLLGNIIKTEVYLEGSKPDNIQNYEINTMKYAPKNDCSTGCWVMMWEERWTDFYNASSPNISEWFYTSSRYDGQRSFYVWQSGNDYTIPPSTSTNPYHSHTDYPHGPAVGSNNHPVEVLKDPSFIGTKAECIYDKLLEINGNLFKETIGTFIDDPKYNLIFKVGDCSNTNIACCDDRNLETTGNIFVVIEDINSNPIQLAQYILHESIHAELIRYVHKYNSGVDVDDRPRLFQLYKFYHDRYDNDAGEIDHIYMTEKFIIPMASALRQLDGNRLPIDYYKAFAWDGLRIWDANGLLNMDPENENFETYRTYVNQTSELCNQTP